ncbi:unnamed protein product, partial [marine sediment metagenome]
ERSDVLYSTVRVMGKNNRSKGIPVYTEMTDNEFLSGRSLCASGTITIYEEMLGRFVKKNGFGDFIGINKIISSTDDFYAEIFRNDKKINKEIITCINEVLVEHYYEGDAVIRLGRFAHNTYC